MNLHERIKAILLEDPYYLGENLGDGIECISEEIPPEAFRDWRHDRKYVYRDNATGELAAYVRERGNTEDCDFDDTISAYSVTAIPATEYRLGVLVEEFTP